MVRTAAAGPAQSAASREPVDAAKISDAALRLFAVQGYPATTMSDIGAAVGIRGPSLYAHVRSKYDLLLELTTIDTHSLLAQQRTALRVGKNARDKVWRMVHDLVVVHCERQLVSVVGRRELVHLTPDDQARVSAIWVKYQRGLRSVIADGHASGEFTVQSPSLACFAILDMATGICNWYRPDGTYSADELGRTYADQALSLLRAKTD